MCLFTLEKYLIPAPAGSMPSTGPVGTGGVMVKLDSRRVEMPKIAHYHKLALSPGVSVR